MARRKTKRFWIDLGSEQVSNMACVMGVALFLRIAYFFGFTRLESAGFMHITFGLVLPLILEAGFLVLIKGVRFRNTELYGLLGAGICLMLFFQCFRYESVLRMALGFSACLGCGATMIAMLRGLVDQRTVKWIFIGVAVGRLVLFNIVQNLLGLHLITLIFEVSAMFDLVALGLFAGCVQSKK